MVDWHPDMSIADTDRAREVYLAERARSGGVDVSDPAEMVHPGDRAAVADYLGGLGLNVDVRQPARMVRAAVHGEPTASECRYFGSCQISNWMPSGSRR